MKNGTSVGINRVAQQPLPLSLLVSSVAGSLVLLLLLVLVVICLVHKRRHQSELESPPVAVAADHGNSQVRSAACWRRASFLVRIVGVETKHPELWREDGKPPVGEIQGEESILQTHLHDSRIMVEAIKPAQSILDFPIPT
ncbi:hypothetical protein INR49_028231 [Caranx melampygus]|nr:hypothetical protein INR49_028231 [Caranx melampygus]